MWGGGDWVEMWEGMDRNVGTGMDRNVGTGMDRNVGGMVEMLGEGDG